MITIFGDIMWNYVVRPSECLPVETKTKKLGGILLNVSLAAKKYFEDVVAIGTVGSDDYDEVLQYFTRNGIKPQIQKNSRHNTGVCLLSYEGDARISITSIRQANMYLDVDEEIENQIKNSRFLFVGGWSLLPESKTSLSIVKMISVALKHDVPVVFDVLPHHLDESHMTSHYRHVLASSTVVVCEEYPRERNTDVAVDMGMIHKLSKKANFFILYDWVRSVRVVDKHSQCLEDVTLDYDTKSAPTYMDGVTISLVKKYLNIQ